MSGLSFTTLICWPDFRFPASYAFARIRWIAAITSACWFADTSPSAEVHPRFCASFSSTLGNCSNAITEGSHSSSCAACCSGSPVRFGLVLTKASAASTWSGYVEAPRICATSASGYKAIGATSASISFGGTGAYTSCRACAGIAVGQFSAPAPGGIIAQISKTLRQIANDCFMEFMVFCAR